MSINVFYKLSILCLLSLLFQVNQFSKYLIHNKHLFNSQEKIICPANVFYKTSILVYLAFLFQVNQFRKCFSQKEYQRQGRLQKILTGTCFNWKEYQRQNILLQHKCTVSIFFITRKVQVIYLFIHTHMSKPTIKFPNHYLRSIDQWTLHRAHEPMPCGAHLEPQLGMGRRGVFNLFFGDGGLVDKWPRSFHHTK